jgi:hypothetical protein
MVPGARSVILLVVFIEIFVKAEIPVDEIASFLRPPAPITMVWLLSIPVHASHVPVPL